MLEKPDSTHKPKIVENKKKKRMMRMILTTKRTKGSGFAMGENSRSVLWAAAKVARKTLTITLELRGGSVRTWTNATSTFARCVYGGSSIVSEPRHPLV